MWWIRVLGAVGPLRVVVTRATKVLLLPGTILIGFLGTQAEEYFRKDKMLEDTSQPPAWQRRSNRDLEEDA